LAVRKLIPIIVILAVAGPASGMSMPEWDMLFVKALWQRGHSEIASQQADRMIKEAGKGPEWAGSLTQLAGSFLEIGTETIEEQRELIARANTALEAAAKADPEVVKTLDYRIEVIIIGQRVAGNLAKNLGDTQGDQRKKLYKEIDEAFEKVQKGFAEIIKENNAKLDEIYRENPQTEDGVDDQERRIDKLFMEVSIHKLREAIALYDWFDTFEERRDEKKRPELLKSLTEKLETLAWEGEGNSILLYAKYYEGLVHKKEKNFEKAVEAFKVAVNAPEEIQVPQIMVPLYLEYVDALIKTEGFREANALLNAVRRRPNMAAGNEARLDILRATNLYAWSYHTKVYAPGQAAKHKELYDEAMAVCRQIVKERPEWIGTVNKLMDEWSRKIKGGEGERDVNVLMARGRVLYTEKNYLQAIEPFQQIVEVVKSPEKIRVHAGWYLVMCCYHLGLNYEAAAAADFLVMRFDPAEFEYSERAFNTAIVCLQKQFQKTGDRFDDNLYISFRKKLGEGSFLIYEGRKLMEQGMFEQALAKLREVPKDSDEPGAAEVYAMALYLSADCHNRISDNHWKKKEYAEALDLQAKAAKLFQNFLKWSAEHPAEGNAAARRQEIEARTIYELARLLTGTAGMKGARFETYYDATIKRGRPNKAELAEHVRKCAEGMLQDVPKKQPEDKQAALDMIRDLVQKRHVYVLELTEGFSTRYPDAVELAPYSYHLRMTAAMQAGEAASAEADLAELKKYPEFESRMGSIYGNLATVFDSKARKLEKDEQAQAAQEALDKALMYYQEMLRADAEQSFDMLYYIILTMHRHGRNVALNTKLDLITATLEKFGHEAVPASKVVRLRLIHADWLFEHGDQAPALKIYHDLNEELEKEYLQRKENNPAAVRTAEHWSTLLGLAQSRKALGQHREAIHNFDTIRKNITGGSDTWWNATYEMLDCMVEAKDVQNKLVIQNIQTNQLLRPTLGGPEMRNKFLLLLAKLAATDDEEISNQALELIKVIEDHPKTTEDTRTDSGKETQ